VAVLARLRPGRPGREHRGLTGRAQLRRRAFAVARSDAAIASARPTRETALRRRPHRARVGAALPAPEPGSCTRTTRDGPGESDRTTRAQAPADQADQGGDRTTAGRQTSTGSNQTPPAPGRGVTGGAARERAAEHLLAVPAPPGDQAGGVGGGGGSASSCGNRTSIVAPTSVSSTRTVPPCDSTIAATIASPSPAPPVVRARAGSPR